MGNFTGIGKLPSELTEKTSLSESDIVITGSAAQRTTWKNVLEKISFSGLATTAKNIIGAINELNTKIAKNCVKAVDGSYLNTLVMRNLELSYTGGEATYDLSDKSGVNTNAVGIATFPYKTCAPATAIINNTTLKVIHSDRTLSGNIYTSVILFIW